MIIMIDDDNIDWCDRYAWLLVCCWAQKIIVYYDMHELGTI